MPSYLHWAHRKVKSLVCLHRLLSAPPLPVYVRLMTWTNSSILHSSILNSISFILNQELLNFDSVISDPARFWFISKCHDYSQVLFMRWALPEPQAQCGVTLWLYSLVTALLTCKPEAPCSPCMAHVHWGFCLPPHMHANPYWEPASLLHPGWPFNCLGAPSSSSLAKPEPCCSLEGWTAIPSPMRSQSLHPHLSFGGFSSSALGCL